MAEDKFASQDEPKDEDEDVEAHKRQKNLSDELRATDESDDSDDVEAHRKHKV
jgi:hypothetical protein